VKSKTGSSKFTEMSPTNLASGTGDPSGQLVLHSPTGMEERLVCAQLGNINGKPDENNFAPD
jgi:hypothetical protein